MNKARTFKLQQIKGELFQERNSLAIARSGLSKFITDEVTEFSTDTIIGGHDGTHPIMSSILESFGFAEVTQGSALNEILVISVSLGIVPEFEKNFRVLNQQSIQSEIDRIKFLLMRRVTDSHAYLLEESFGQLIKVFKLARLLGKLISLQGKTEFAVIRELYRLHLSWYYDNTDSDDFLITSFSSLKLSDYGFPDRILDVIHYIKKNISSVPKQLR